MRPAGSLTGPDTDRSTTRNTTRPTARPEFRCRSLVDVMSLPGSFTSRHLREAGPDPLVGLTDVPVRPLRQSRLTVVVHE